MSTPPTDLASAPPGRKRILAISSGGGHWLQLQRIRECFAGHDIAYATVHASARAEVPGARFYPLRDASRWNKLGLVVLAAQTLRIVLKERPDVLVTTGAAPGLLGVVFGKCLGARTLWIDSIANAEKLSLSGRLAGHFADAKPRWLESGHPAEAAPGRRTTERRSGRPQKGGQRMPLVGRVRIGSGTWGAGRDKDVRETSMAGCPGRTRVAVAILKR